MAMKLLIRFASLAVVQATVVPLPDAAHTPDPLLSRKVSKITNIIEARLARLQETQLKEVKKADFCKSEVKGLKKRMAKEMQNVKEKMQLMAKAKANLLKFRQGGLNPEDVAARNTILKHDTEAAVSAAKDFAIDQNWEVLNPAYDASDQFPKLFPSTGFLQRNATPALRSKPTRAQLAENVKLATDELSISRSALETDVTRMRRSGHGVAQEAQATQGQQATVAIEEGNEPVPERAWKEAKYNLKKAMEGLEVAEKEKKLINEQCVVPTKKQTPEERAEQRQKEIEGLTLAGQKLNEWKP